MNGLARRDRPEGVHKPRIQLINPYLIRVTYFDDPLDMPQVTQLKTRAIMEPTGRREKNEGQDHYTDDVILPASALVGPENRPPHDQLGLGPERGIPAIRGPIPGARKGWFAELGTWRHTPVQ